PFARNRQYFRVMLDAGAATVTGTTYYLETATGEESAAYAGTAPTDVAPYAEYPPADVAEFLADIPASSAGTRYGDIQAGCRVLLEHSGNDEMEFLPGPVVFKRPHEADPSDATAITDAERLQSGQRRAGAGVLTGDVLAVAVTRAMHPDSRTPVNLSGPGRMGAIAGLDPATGETKWRYSPWYALAQPLDAAGNFMATDMRHYVDAAPADAGDAIIGAASLEDPATPEEGAVGSIFALDPRPDATIRVRVEPAADPAAVVLSQAPLTGTSVASVGLSPVVQIVDAHNGGDWDTTPLGVPVLDPSCYTVDYENLRITIPAERAHDVRDIDGNRLGPAWGKMVILTYAYDDQGTPEDLTDDAFVEGEVGVVPDIARWEYVPGRIRLRNHPFVWAGGAIGVSARLPNGMPVQGFSVGGGTVVVNGLTWAGHGWLDVDAATFGQAPVPLPMGADVEISYQGMTVDGAIEVPNANDDWERHQVPYVIGRTIAPIAVANGGRTILVGTESYNPDQSVDRSPDASPYVGGFDRAGLVTDATRTLLTLTWDRVTNYVHGELVRPANRAPGALGVPIMSNAAAVRGDTALVGSRTIIEVPDTSGTPPEGYGGDPTIVAVGHAAGLSPSRTVITDNQRIIETVGTRLDWVCSGTRVLDVAWQNVAAEARAGFPGTVPVMRRPFSRPAKAIRLTRPDFLAPYTDAAGTLIAYNEAIYPPESGGSVPAGVPAGTPWPPAESGIGPGTYLVVDTGNNRVVEVDRAGRQVWPLDNIGDGTGGLAGSRRAGDHLGFDFYSSPYNTTLVLNAPSDAHRYMEWDTATDTWLMHTVIADSGNYRVVDVITTFDYDYTTGAVLQYHAIEVVTPGYVHAVYGPRAGEYIRVAYTKAVPITDPNNGDVVGYLCAGSNLHELLVVEHGTEQINPAAGAAMPSGTGLTWSMWSWLYDHDDDADADTDERLIFQNIRHVSADYCTDENGATYIYLMVVCGRYRGPLADPYMLTDTLGNEAGACCVEFRVDPATASHVPSTLGWAVPYWAYTDRDYEAGPLGHLWTPPGEGNAGAARAVKTFLPVCAQRIPGGRHIIATYASAVDNLTHVNLDTATDAIFGTPPSLGSEIFDVETTYGTANDPSTQMHTIDVNRCIPNPWGDAWTDPVNQPSFVQRSQDSPAPLRP
ncbi:MAG TPA: hypothetical protein QGH10_23290, partial [Armatimonadota bacterium]|nr:hypothetical protein [Armatimonadota bacterium]